MLLFNNIKIVFRAEQYQIHNLHMGIFRNCFLLFPASFKLAQIGSFHMLHPLPCLITFNIARYINERELRNWCGVSSICNSLHIELHLTCSIVCCTLPCHALLNRTCIILVCASYHVYVMVIYHVVCFFPVLLLRVSSDNFAFVRIRSTTLRTLQARWPYLRYHFYLCFASTRFIAMLALPAFVYHASLLPCQTSNHPVLANRCVAMSPLLLSPSYSVASCRWRWSLFLVGTWIFLDITVSHV